MEEALDAYEGTILTISHDRYFLDRVATQILALDGAGGAEHYDGDYTEYHDWKAEQEAGDKPRRSEGKPGVKVIKKKKAGGRAPEVIETEIAAAERDLRDISEQMGNSEVARDPQRLQSSQPGLRRN